MYFAVELADGTLDISTCAGNTKPTAWLTMDEFPDGVREICGPFKTRGGAYRAIAKRHDELDATTAELAEAAGVPA